MEYSPQREDEFGCNRFDIRTRFDTAVCWSNLNSEQGILGQLKMSKPNN